MFLNKKKESLILSLFCLFFLFGCQNSNMKANGSNDVDKEMNIEIESNVIDLNEIHTSVKADFSLLRNATDVHEYVKNDTYSSSLEDNSFYEFLLSYGDEYFLSKNLLMSPFMVDCGDSVTFKDAIYHNNGTLKLFYNYIDNNGMYAVLDEKIDVVNIDKKYEVKNLEIYFNGEKYGK